MIYDNYTRICVLKFDIDVSLTPTRIGFVPVFLFATGHMLQHSLFIAHQIEAFWQLQHSSLSLSNCWVTVGAGAACAGTALHWPGTGSGLLRSPAAAVLA